ncbi:MAG TPA: YggT family protein [Gemmatimonadales bacterium]|nr:YggT family protein [Gemmatimonadales bacterium]
MTPLQVVDLALRGLVFAAFGASAVVAVTHWLVRTKRIGPFGAWPRLVRRTSDPVLQPVERRLLRAGGNPQDAPLWLVGGALVGGLVLLAFVRWLIRFVAGLAYAASAGPGVLLATLLNWVFGLLVAALFIRVIASWFGASEYAKWMRPFVFLTEWLLVPIRRAMPRTGMFDLSPIIAYIVLRLLRWAVFSILPV